EDSNNDGTLNGTELSGAVDITITLPGGAVADDTIRVSDGSTTTDVVLDATDITNGSVTTTFASPGEGNTLTVTAVLIDQIGNTSPAGSDSVTVDTTPDNDGDTNTVTVDSITSDTGSDTNDFVTNDNALIISGTVDLGDIGNDLTVNFAGTDYTTSNLELVVDAGGNWALDLTAITLADNTYTVTATVTDPVGNTTSAVQNITIGQVATDDQTTAISETNLPGPDIANGMFTFADVDGDSLTATLVEPTFELMSNEEAVTWTGDGTQLLVGSTLANGEVIRVTIDNTGSYVVTLSGPLDHPVGNAQDILAFDVSVDVTDGTSTATGKLNISIEDDIPVVEDSQVQFSINAAPATISGENLLGDTGTFGNDGGFIETIKIGGITYTYDTDTDTVSTAGASNLVISHTFNDANDELTIDTIKGETLVVDMLTSDYDFTASGIPVIAPIANEAPEVGVYEEGGLLGIVGADLLGLVDFSQHQLFTATDANNNIESVVVDYDPVLALDVGFLTGAGIRTWTYSSELAQEFGLDIQLDVSDITLLTINVTDYARLTITSLDGGSIDNLQLNEFLGTLALTGSALSLDLLSSINIAATDTNAANDAEDANNLLNTSLLGNTPPSVIQEGTASGETLNGDGGNDRLYGYGGADTLNGLGGNDILRGGSGSDTVNGGTGNDIIIGGTGNDTKTGDTGTDVFLWEEGHAGAAGSPAIDEITDFDTASLASGGDLLDLGHLLQGEGRIGSLPGNLSNYLHFELSGGNTIVHISTEGNYAGGFVGGQTDQQITLTGVDLVTGFASDQDIIAGLLASEKLIVDDATSSTNIVGGYTDVAFTAADNDGDTAGGSIRFDSSGINPLPENNSPPDVQVSATALLGLIGIEALNLIDLSNQDFNAADRDGNLQQVILRYAPTLALDLGGLFDSPELTASTAMATELGLEFDVVNDPGLLGLVAPSSTLTITAIGGGTIDNQAINELLGSVQFDQDISLLSNLLQVDVLNATTITAVDSLGAASTDTAATLASANLLNSLNGNLAILEGAGGDNSLNGSNDNDRLYGYGGNDILNGNDGNDLLRGGDGNDTLNGNDGNDLIFAGAGADEIYGGAGDDLLIIEVTAFTTIDGGAGDDTLSLSGAGVVLDFIADLDPNDVDNIEEVDLNGSGANSITLNGAAVLELTDGNNLLRLEGEVDDTADLRDAVATGTTPVFAGDQYVEYELGAATVWVNDAITVVDNG
ncbi:MAG: Ig-like domain-containing protein, partial [Porticoccaceae bacterium]|nr:Ig-like domain-containing protein [Porticoccaceae bacterium]